MVAATVDAALGLPIAQPMQKPVKGFWSSIIIHSRESGRLKNIWFSDGANKYTVEKNIQVEDGDKVNAFSGSHDTLGAMIMEYPSKEEMLEMLDNMERDIRVIVD